MKQNTTLGIIVALVVVIIIVLLIIFSNSSTDTNASADNTIDDPDFLNDLGELDNTGSDGDLGDSDIIDFGE